MPCSSHIVSPMLVKGILPNPNLKLRLGGIIFNYSNHISASACSKNVLSQPKSKPTYLNSTVKMHIKKSSPVVGVGGEKRHPGILNIFP